MHGKFGGDMIVVTNCRAGREVSHQQVPVEPVIQRRVDPAAPSESIEAEEQTGLGHRVVAVEQHRPRVQVPIFHQILRPVTDDADRHRQQIHAGGVRDGDAFQGSRQIPIVGINPPEPPLNPIADPLHDRVGLSPIGLDNHMVDPIPITIKDFDRPVVAPPVDDDVPQAVDTLIDHRSDTRTQVSCLIE